MATYTGIKKIKIGDNVFELDMPSTAADVGIKFGYTTSGNNRAVLQDSSGNLYVTQKDDDSDTKVSTAAVTSGTTYYPVVGADTTSAATKFYDKTGIVYKGTNGTTSAVGSAILTLGNSTASGTANNKQGKLVLYGSTAYAHTISGAPTAARTLTLPNATGTIALTSDIPDVSGKIDTAGTGLSKSGTTLNHSNAVAAQSTQAIYPIKIDGQGHISAYGTAVTPLTSSSSLNAAKLTGTVPASCYTNTTYTFANGTNGFTVTPSGGTAQTVTVTPSLDGDIWESLFNIIYPVYSFFETTDTTFDPNTATGWYGTWELEAEGLVHIGACSTYTVGATGGNKDAIIPYHRHSYNAPPSKTGSHTLTTSEIPAHTHGSKTLTGNANFRKWTTGKLLTYTDGIFSATEPTTSATSVESSGTNPNKVDRLTITATHEHTSVGGGGGHTHDITASSTNTGYAGTSGNLTNANMQPYKVVNRWYRTA